MINFLNKNKTKITVAILLLIITILATKVVMNKPINIDFIAYNILVN